ncbi:HEPN domain-containing protein [Dictyoglomus sp.]|uniref:HEPN domain-containing protein n=1 Tax=Dictyoglomus sp. TaxID=28205 RepID=UPI003CBB8A73
MEREAAKTLFENGLIRDALSRLYCYALHMVKALLFTKGFELKNHEETLRLLSLYFIKGGRLQSLLCIF